MWLEGRGKIGFLAAHRSVMGHLVTDHAFAAEFSCIYRGNGESNWHKAYNKPLFGLTGFYGSVGNRELMGNFAGAYGFISIPQEIIFDVIEHPYFQRLMFCYHI